MVTWSAVETYPISINSRAKAGINVYTCYEFQSSTTNYGIRPHET